MTARQLPFAATALFLLLAAPAAAGEAFAGVYDHDIDDRISFGNFESGPQIVVGARTTDLEELDFLFKPRVHVLAGVNTRGGTNYMAIGLSKRFNLSKRFYVQPGVGVGIHDGKINLPSPDEPGISSAEVLKRIRDQATKLDLGSRVLFEPEFSIGWKATERLSFEASWIHFSHAQLAGPQNPGLGDIGIRLVYRYGEDRGF